MPRPATGFFLPPSAAGAKPCLTGSNARAIKPYDATQYRRDIVDGKRRSTGVLKLKRLTGRHIAILKLHLLGLSNNDVADRFGVTPPVVSKVINDPLGQEYLQRSYQDVDKEFEALYGETVNTLRDGLGSERMADRLKTVDIIYKKRGDYTEPVRPVDTAEDVIKRIMELNINVKVGLDQQQLPAGRILENDDE